MTINNMTAKISNLWENNRKFRFACYALLVIGLAVAGFGLGTRLGEYAYVITH